MDNESSLTWSELRSTCTEASDGAFLATVQQDGRPHLAWVGVGFTDDERLWTATYASSQKAKNLRHERRVALHWPESADKLIFMRATARLLTDSGEIQRVWGSDVLPYDQEAFFGSADNPELLFVELSPTLASVHSGEPGERPVRWRPQRGG